jgi:hypothetical protein
MSLADSIGSCGVGLLLLGYLFTILKILKMDSRIFIWMNVIGGTLACVASVLIHYVPFIVLEGAWAVVSIFALIKSIGKEHDADH